MQQQLEQLPLIKKPLEIIGEYVNVPGAFWEGRMSAAEKEMLYKCVVRDQVPPGAHGADVYSAHPNDTTGMWRGDAAVIAQIDAERAAKK